MHKRFRENENAIVPILENFHSITDATPILEIHCSLAELDSHIEQMCWVFIDFHEVFAALKLAKKRLRSKGGDASIATRLRAKLEDQYSDSKKHYPSILPQPLCSLSYLKKNNCAQLGSIATQKYTSRPAFDRILRLGRHHGVDSTRLSRTGFVRDMETDQVRESS